MYSAPRLSPALLPSPHAAKLPVRLNSSQLLRLFPRFLSSNASRRQRAAKGEAVTMRAGTRTICALALVALCFAAHFEGAFCRGGGGGGRGGGGGARGGGGFGRGGRGGRPFLAGAGVGAAVGMGARGSHGHGHSSADAARGRGAWRMAGAGAALAAAALAW